MFVSVDAKSNLRDCREVVGVLRMIVKSEVGQVDLLYLCLNGQNVHFPGGVGIPQTSLHAIFRRGIHLEAARSHLPFVFLAGYLQFSL